MTLELKPTQNPQKILIIRFSSFGDVLQCLSVIQTLKDQWPESEIHWVTRSEFAPLIENHPHITKVWSLDRKLKIQGLIELAQKLHQFQLHRIYDAHNNLRSRFLCAYLFWFSLLTRFSKPIILRRSIKRWKRFLLFQFRINLFEKPLSGQRDLIEPLMAWGISKKIPPPPQLFFDTSILAECEIKLINLKPYIALAPSAAFALKRWPVSHWKALIELILKEHPSVNIVTLGGKEDLFINEFTLINPQRIFNFAGKLTLLQSSAVVSKSLMLIANDTGLLHVGEQLGHPSIALMGPAPFGFPSRTDSTRILELNLHCRPCSKHGQGPCYNPNFHLCMVGITPEMVFKEAQLLLPSLNTKGLI